MHELDKLRYAKACDTPPDRGDAGPAPLSSVAPPLVSMVHPPQLPSAHGSFIMSDIGAMEPVSMHGISMHYEQPGSFTQQYDTSF